VIENTSVRVQGTLIVCKVLDVKYSIQAVYGVKYPVLGGIRNGARLPLGIGWVVGPFVVDGSSSIVAGWWGRYAKLAGEKSLVVTRVL
jgi:hypothetical protein